MDGVDVWSDPGTARLDRNWWANVRVNDVLDEGKIYPRLSFVLTNTMGTTETHFLVVWEDEHVEDHNPDIYFDRSTDGGRSWSADVRVSEPHQSGRRKNAPDITVRLADESFWVVWQDNRNDDGDIYYSVSHDQGNNWDPPASVYTGTGTQLLPRIAPHGQSGYLYTVWEDERADDGDIYISRYNPDVDLAWGTPVKVSDDTTGAQQREPNLAVDADGNVYVIWEDMRDDPPYDARIYFSRWISGTAWGTWSTNVRLNNPGVHFAEDPDIVAGPGGVLFAAWMERVPTDVGGGYAFQIVAGRSDDGGDTWSRSIVHWMSESTGLVSYGAPAIGVGVLGRVYVAWVRCPSLYHAEANVLFSLSPDGGVHWTEPRTLSRPLSTVDCAADTDLVIGSDGEVVVAWSDYRGTSAPQIYATGYPAGHYLISGKYRRHFDAGGPAAWGTITWTATITPGTNLALATRVMTTAGAGWTEWFTYTASGDAIPHPSGRFIQYRAVFTSAGNDTPVLDAVVISYEQYRIFLPLVLREG